MICCLWRKCVNLISFIHRLQDGVIIHCKWASCVICAWSHSGVKKQEYSWRLFGHWWSKIFSYLFMSRKKCRAGEERVEALSELREFYHSLRLHASGGQVSPWFGMQYNGQGALLRAECIVCWSNLVVLSSHHECNAPLSRSLILPPTLPVVPFSRQAFPPPTLRSFPPSWWVSQLTICPTTDPERLGSTTVQAMTGWEK